jgi:hypothetical protein
MHESRGNVGQMNMFLVSRNLPKSKIRFLGCAAFYFFRLPGVLPPGHGNRHVSYVSLGLNFCLHFRPFTGLFRDARAGHGHPPMPVFA